MRLHRDGDRRPIVARRRSVLFRKNCRLRWRKTNAMSCARPEAATVSVLNSAPRPHETLVSVRRHDRTQQTFSTFRPRQRSPLGSPSRPFVSRSQRPFEKRVSHSFRSSSPSRSFSRQNSFKFKRTGARCDVPDSSSSVGEKQLVKASPKASARGRVIRGPSPAQTDPTTRRSSRHSLDSSKSRNAETRQRSPSRAESVRSCWPRVAFRM